MNPANFKPFIDPNSGEWIQITHKSAKDVVWRPIDIGLTEDGKFKFDVEFFEGPGVVSINEENQDDVARMINKIMTELLAQEQAELETLAEQTAVKIEEDPLDAYNDDRLATNFDLESRLSEIDVLKGGTQVSAALMPQDIQSDLAQISSIIGGVAPK